MLKGHQAEYEKLQTAFKQANVQVRFVRMHPADLQQQALARRGSLRWCATLTVQVRRNTEAAAAKARKAMLAGGQAHNAPSRAAGQADVVAASQGITKSLLRSRQLMAQVCCSLGYNCSCLQYNAAGI